VAAKTGRGWAEQWPKKCRDKKAIDFNAENGLVGKLGTFFSSPLSSDNGSASHQRSV
jgi:hypothetical protein